MIEAHGLPTVCVVMSREIAATVKPPRALYVRFPYGAPLGPAGRPDIQMAIIRAALALLEELDRPGTIVEAGVEWPE